MSYTADALAQRVTSAANVSVGTSLAMETILPSWPVFDPARVAPAKERLLDYQFIYLNIWTLARNLHNAIPTQYRNNIQGKEAAETLAEEALEIINAVKNATAGAVNAVVYYPTYRSLAKNYPKGLLRQNVTDKAKQSQAVLDDMCEHAMKILKTNAKDSVATFDVAITPGKFGSSILFTHFPVDLLSEHRLGKCVLLESHTGVVKRKNLWYTKLFNGKALSNIPFNALTLQVFGDDHQFRPWEIKIKQALLEMAQKHRWSWATTVAKMRLDVRVHPDRLFAAALQELL